MCGLLAVQEPAITATVEVMLRKAETNYKTKKTKMFGFLDEFNE